VSTSILILAAGPSLFDSTDEGYPTCLHEHEGVPLIDRIIKNTSNINDKEYAFALRKEDIDKYYLDKIAILLAPGALIINVAAKTKGSACTALLATCQMNPDNDLIIISANELVCVDFSLVITDFKKRKIDAGVLVFKSVHPRYSYVRLDEHELVTQSAQKEPISKNATAGVFWFSKVSLFVEAAKKMIVKNDNLDGEFYIAPVLNEIILQHSKVGIYKLALSCYIPLKSERQFQQYEIGGRGEKI